ncbi:transposase [Micromonosporaceae bacterium Da 78-11]
MARQKRTYSQEYRDEAVKMVIETSRPIAVVARELGLLEGTLGNWVSA